MNASVGRLRPWVRARPARWTDETCAASAAVWQLTKRRLNAERAQVRRTDKLAWLRGSRRKLRSDDPFQRMCADARSIGCVGVVR